jgi:NTP pyrophosphatase (non-canonical NTP hydrolase)
MDIGCLRDQVHENAVLKGFWDNPCLPRSVALVCSELFEMIEAHRKGMHADVLKYIADKDLIPFCENFEKNIKDTFEDELADVVIRLLDIAGWLKLDVSFDYSGIDFEKLEPEDDEGFFNMVLDMNKGISEIAKCIDKSCAGSVCHLFIYAFIGAKTIANYFQFSLDYHIIEKMEYNKTRERLHGKRY